MLIGEFAFIRAKELKSVIIIISKVFPYLHKKECSYLWIMTSQKLVDFYDQLPDLQVSLLCFDHINHSQGCYVALFGHGLTSLKKEIAVQPAFPF